jgi:DNA-binding transcriptional MerR regulator
MTSEDAPLQADGVGVERALPPIHRIKEPPMHHMSTRIRWFKALGYEVKEISAYLGVRYQQVRNVVTTTPKRMAREDLPAITIELLDMETDLELMESQALMENMAVQRAQDRKAKKATNAARRALKAKAAGGELEGGETVYDMDTVSDEDLDHLDSS